MRKVVFDSPCRTHHAHFCVSSGGSCCGWVHIFSGCSFIALPVMAGNHRCLFALTLGHLARCLFPFPFFSLTMQMPTNRQDMVLSPFPFLLSPFPFPSPSFSPDVVHSAVSPSSLSSPRSSSYSCAAPVAQAEQGQQPQQLPHSGQSWWTGHCVTELAQV